MGLSIIGIYVPEVLSSAPYSLAESCGIQLSRSWDLCLAAESPNRHPEDGGASHHYQNRLLLSVPTNQSKNKIFNQIEALTPQ